VSLDHVVETCDEVGNTTLHFAGAGSVVECLFRELRLMLQPLRVACIASTELRGRFDVYQRRFDNLLSDAASCPDDRLSDRAISTLAGLSENGHDTVRQLAIDLHWELNQLQAGVSMETIDGARVYTVIDADRRLVRAFMKGIDETIHLKFDHPGLGTTATHVGDGLLIQNDLGTSEGHVVVVHVTGLSATVNYADVHRRRIRFLQDLLQPYAVEWDDSTLTAATDWQMSVGRYTADTAEDLERFLTFLGSRLVFLVDWNRARKRLARLVRKSDAVKVLKWAADNNVGHGGFLRAGEIGLIDAALERTASVQIQPGARLDELIGRDAARLFLIAVLRIASSAVSAGRTPSLIEDEVQAELLRYLETPDRQMLRHAADQATVISAFAEHLRAAIQRLKSGALVEQGRGESPELVKAWSTRVHEIARHSGRLVDRTSNGHRFQQLLIEAGAAAGALEETAFMLTLVPDAVDPKALSLLDGLADLVDGAVREYVRCLEDSRGLSPTSPRSDIDGFLVTVDRLVDLNHQASASRRLIIERLLQGSGDFRGPYALATVAQGLERTATALARCGLIVRDSPISAPPLVHAVEAVHIVEFS
jgi:hypothetical protein